MLLCAAAQVAIKLANLHTDKAQHTFEAQQQELSALAHLAAAAAAAHHSPDGAAAGGGSGAACGGGGGVGSHPHLVEFKGLVSRRDGAQALVLGRCEGCVFAACACCSSAAAPHLPFC